MHLERDFLFKISCSKGKFSKDTLMGDAKQLKPETNEVENWDESFRNGFPDYLE